MCRKGAKIAKFAKESFVFLAIFPAAAFRSRGCPVALAAVLKSPHGVLLAFGWLPKEWCRCSTLAPQCHLVGYAALPTLHWPVPQRTPDDRVKCRLFATQTSFPTRLLDGMLPDEKHFRARQRGAYNPGNDQADGVQRPGDTFRRRRRARSDAFLSDARR